MAKLYKTTKETFDIKAFMYLMKRLHEEMAETDGCNLKITDSVGNVLKDTTPNTAWAYTMLDQFVSLLKTKLGEDNLSSLFSNFEYLKSIDPLFIMNMKAGTDLHKVKDALDKIISRIHDKTYLPEDLHHDESFVELDNDGLNYCDHASKALTIATYLIYTLKTGEAPREFEFNENVLPSVEHTFNIRSIGSYNEIYTFCDNNKLIDFNKVTNSGMRILVDIAKFMVSGGILSTSKDRIENQTHNWKRLSEL